MWLDVDSLPTRPFGDATAWMTNIDFQRALPIASPGGAGYVGIMWLRHYPQGLGVVVCESDPPYMPNEELWSKICNVVN